MLYDGSQDVGGESRYDSHSIGPQVPSIIVGLVFALEQHRDVVEREDRSALSTAVRLHDHPTTTSKSKFPSRASLPNHSDYCS